jgi:hypothetical protein
MTANAFKVALLWHQVAHSSAKATNQGSSDLHTCFAEPNRECPLKAAFLCCSDSCCHDLVLNAHVRIYSNCAVYKAEVKVQLLLCYGLLMRLLLGTCRQEGEACSFS